MKVEYDDEADAAFLWLTDQEPIQGIIANEIWPRELNEHVGMLFNEDGKIVGIEVLFASRYLQAEILEGKASTISAKSIQGGDAEE